MSRDSEKVVLKWCYGSSFLIFANVDIGPTDPRLTMPFDATTELGPMFCP
jgi:hypothetical protein